MKNYLFKIVRAKTKVMMSIPPDQPRKDIALTLSSNCANARNSHPTHSKDRPINAHIFKDLLINQTLQQFRNKANNLSTT